MLDPSLRLLGSPKEYNRLGDVNDLQNMSYRALRTYYHHIISCKLPLTTAEFEDTLFGQSIQLFSDEPPAASGPECSVQTNALRATSVTSPFMICGVGIVAIGESKSFAMQGLVSNTEGAATDATIVGDPKVGNELYAGMLSNFTGDGGVMGQMWWGGPTWNLIEAFLQAYRLQFALGGRWLIIDESLQDIGLTRQSPKFVGAGESRLATAPYIQDVNNTLAAKDFGLGGSSPVFLPINTMVDADGASASVPPPLSSFMQGNQDIPGLAQRVFTLRNPILVVPGMPIDASFVLVKGSSYFGALQNKVTFNITALSSSITAGTTGQGSTTIATVPGGRFQFGLVLLGFEMWPAACLDYLSSLMSPYSGAMAGTPHPFLGAYAENPWVMGMINKYRNTHGSLAGTLAGIPKQS